MTAKQPTPQGISTDRIRWHDGPDDGEATGYVGTLDRPVFRIWPPNQDGDCLLFVYLAGQAGNLYHGDSADGLKAEAERLLTEFVASFGAIFGDAVAADLRSRAAELEMMVDRRPGQERDNLLFAAGLKRAADLAEFGDRPAVNPDPNPSPSTAGTETTDA